MRRNFGMVILVALVGLIVGQLLSMAVPVQQLRTAADLGFRPITVDLLVLNFTLGFSIHLSVAGVIGMLAGLYLMLRYK